MKPRNSPLNIIDCALINLEFNYIQSEGKNGIDLRNKFLDYDLDIDFGIQGDEVIQVLIKAEINKGTKKLPGYSILAEAVCLYEFNKEVKISEEAKNNIEGFSTIYIALNALRGFISQLTANAPLGRYVLPSVDLNDLIGQKKSQMIKASEKAAIKKKKPSKKIGGK